MDPKQQALSYIQAVATARLISREEALEAYDRGFPPPAHAAASPTVSHSPAAAPGEHLLTKRLGAAELMYGIGGAIIFLGIAILIWQNWALLSTPVRILSTLGSGLVAYCVGLLLGRHERFEGISSAFHLVAALVFPIGLGVTLHEAGADTTSLGLQTAMSAVLFAVYLASFLVLRRTVFVLFSILFGTWFFYSLTGMMLQSNPGLDQWKFIEYRTLLSGLTFMLLGHALSKTRYLGLTGFLYGFGILGFLGAALSLGGWQPNQNIFWELAFPILVFGALYASVYLKSGSFLTFGSMFLMAYILKITAEYFTASLGWPLALVMAGLLLIGVGYLSISIKRNYLKTA